jgi:hypothetical protein
MRKLQLAIALLLAKFFAFANNQAPEQDIALKWEQQVRPWVHGVAAEKPPLLLLRLMDEVGPQEDMLSVYQGRDGKLVFAWARSREVTAQSIFNMYKYKIEKPAPPIPVELRVGPLGKEAFRSLLKACADFIEAKPKSWDELVLTGHAGSVFAYREGVSFSFQGPTHPKSEPTVAKLSLQIRQVQKGMKVFLSNEVYEFPQTEEMTQWRFNRALMNGVERRAIYLLSIGASPNKDPHFFESPLEQSVLHGSKALFEALIKHGANTKITTSTGSTLEEFANKHNAPWASMLLRKSEKQLKQ